MFILSGQIQVGHKVLSECWILSCSVCDCEMKSDLEGRVERKLTRAYVHAHARETKAQLWEARALC